MYDLKILCKGLDDSVFDWLVYYLKDAKLTDKEDKNKMFRYTSWGMARGFVRSLLVTGKITPEKHQELIDFIDEEFHFG